MDFLKEILGEELYSQTKEKVDSYNNDHKDKQVKLVNLSEGNYVSKEKFDSKETEIANLRIQIENANNEIQSYKEMDIDSIKKSAEDWETKYNDLVKAQDEAKKESIRKERTNAFFNGVEFASESAKAGVIAQFNQKDFKYDEETNKFQGASEWLEELKKNDVGAFKSEVANPRFTTSVSTPTNSSSMDEVMKVMGIVEEK